MQSQLERFAGRDTAAGYARFMGTAEATSSNLRAILLLEVRRRGARHARSRHDVHASTLADLAALRMGQSVAGTIRRAVPDDARRPDARPLHAVRRLVTLRVARRAVRHRAHADRGRHLVSAGRHARVARGADEARERARRRARDRRGGRAHRSSRVARRAASDRRRRSDRSADAVVSNMDTVRTHESLLGAAHERAFQRRRRYEPACSGVVLYLGLSERYEHLLHHDFVFSEDPEEEFDVDLPRRAAGARSDVLHGGAGRDRPERRAARRRGAVRARPHAVSAPGARLATDVRAVSGADPRQAQDQRRHARHRGTHRVRGAR